MMLLETFTKNHSKMAAGRSDVILLADVEHAGRTQQLIQVTWSLVILSLIQETGSNVFCAPGMWLNLKTDLFLPVNSCNFTLLYLNKTKSRSRGGGFHSNVIRHWPAARLRRL